MKSLLLILILSVYSLQSDVKQYQIYQAVEECCRKVKLEHSYVAITDNIIYVKEDSVMYQFLIDSYIYEHNMHKYLTEEFIERNDTLFILSIGFILVQPVTKKEGDEREHGTITVEARGRAAYRRVIYRYR